MSVKDNTYGIARLQDIMLDILKHLISFCERHELRYCACGGTCIGALRHHGFIPWDDDMDIFMPRTDYEKLWSIYDNTSEPKYKLCRTTPEKNYHHRVMQMVDVDTTFINKRSQNEDIEHGVYIDIIPLDVCPSSKLKRFSQIVNSILFSVYNIQNLPEFVNGKPFIKLAVSLMLKLIRSKDKRADIWQNAEKKMMSNQWGTTEEIVETASSMRALMHPYQAQWFAFNGRKEKFEDMDIVVPDDAEAYLNFSFGDYMQLPPEHERHPVHNTVFVDLENSYMKYKGIYYCVKESTTL